MVVLCDIEGAEFDLFSEKFLSACGGAVLVIEIHEGYHKDRGMLEQFKRRLEFGYHIKISNWTERFEQFSFCGGYARQ